ncbi:MAG: hypothetical protein P8Z36_17570 [Gemmatimonadota bacterium]|jgi:hypothetical protein
MAFVRGSTIRKLLAEFLAIFAGVVLGLLAGRLDAVRADVDAASWLTRSWDRADAPADSTEKALNRFYLTAYYQPSNATYESLKSGDRLHIIQDEELRNTIVWSGRIASWSAGVLQATLDEGASLRRAIADYLR